MKQILKILTVMLLAGSPALGATLSDIQTEISTNLPSASQITAAQLRTVLNDMAAFSNSDLRYGSVYGMVCDNTTDDGPALQTALTNSVNHQLLLPPNATCLIKSFVSIPSNTYLQGQNTILQFDPTATHSGSLDVTMILDGTSGSHLKNVIIDGVTFNGAGSSTPTSNKSKIAGVWVENIVVRNSTFQNFGDITSHTTASNTYTHGFQIFNVIDGYFLDSTYQNNAGDGLSLSNANTRVWIRGNRAVNNYDSGIIPCTIGGDHIYTTDNYVVMSSTVVTATPGIGLDRCSNSVVANNWIDGPAASNCIRVARFGDTAQINKDIHIRGNTCTGGSNISVESLGPTQGSQTVTKGGYWSVVDNTVIGASGTGIYITDSQNGTVTSNRVISAGAEGIKEEAFTGSTGSNLIASNIIDGATTCLRQLASGGTIINTIWNDNDARNCSVALTNLSANLGTDGPAISYTPTVSGAGGTLPTAYNVTGSNWKKIGTNHYRVAISFTVTTLGTPTATFYQFTLPVSATATGAQVCTAVNQTTGANIHPSYIANATSLITIQIGTTAANTYNSTCDLFLN